MWPAGIEPAAPRVSGGRSTGLSYGHVKMLRLSRPAHAERCCPCHSPTLRPWIACRGSRNRRAHVLRGGALEPEPRRWRENSQAKADANANASFQRDAEGLSLSGGASIRSSASSTEHHLVRTDEGRSPPGTKKATHGSPSSGFRSAASDLACRPPSEGSSVVDAALRTGRVPVRQRSGDGRRFDDGAWAVGCGQHCETENRARVRKTQGIHTNF
jgi:hypothetical protein